MGHKSPQQKNGCILGAGEDVRVAMGAYAWTFMFDQLGAHFNSPPPKKPEAAHQGGGNGATARSGTALFVDPKLEAVR